MGFSLLAQVAAIVARGLRASSGSTNRKSQTWPQRWNWKLHSLNLTTSERSGSEKASRSFPTATVCFLTPKRVGARFTLPDHVNVRHGRFGIAISKQRQIGSERAKNAPAVAKENCTNWNQSKNNAKQCAFRALPKTLGNNGPQMMSSYSSCRAQFEGI